MTYLDRRVASLERAAPPEVQPRPPGTTFEEFFRGMLTEMATPGADDSVSRRWIAAMTIDEVLQVQQIIGAELARRREARAVKANDCSRERLAARLVDTEASHAKP